MEAKTFLQVNVSNYGIIPFPATNGEEKAHLSSMYVQKLHPSGVYLTSYQVSMDKDSPTVFVPNLAESYDRIIVEYEDAHEHIVWCRQTHKSTIQISAADYHRVDGELQKRGDIDLPRENYVYPFWVTCIGSRETQVLVKDVWVSPHSGEIAPILWEDDNLFDSLEKQSDFDPMMLDLDDPEMHDMAENMALAFNDAAKQAKIDSEVEA